MDNLTRRTGRHPIRLVRGAWASLYAAWRIARPDRRREAIGISWRLIRSTVEVAGTLRGRKLTLGELLVASGAVS